MAHTLDDEEGEADGLLAKMSEELFQSRTWSGRAHFGVQKGSGRLIAVRLTEVQEAGVLLNQVDCLVVGCAEIADRLHRLMLCRGSRID